MYQSHTLECPAKVGHEISPEDIELVRSVPCPTLDPDTVAELYELELGDDESSSFSATVLAEAQPERTSKQQER